MDSREIIWQYDETYYLGGTSKHTHQHILGVHGAKEFRAKQIASRKIVSANMVPFVDKTVLDVGFARGEILRYCNLNGAKKCIGIDYSPAAFKIATEYINDPNVKLYKLAVTDIDLIEEEDIDVVYLADVLEHVSNKEWKIFFEKIIGKLSPDCVLVGETPCYKHGDYMDMHNNYHDVNSLKDLLSIAFEDIDITQENVHNPTGRPTHFIIKCKGVK